MSDPAHPTGRGTRRDPTARQPGVGLPAPPAERVFVGLGSNEGPREAALIRALAGLERLPGVRLVAASPVYETEPVGEGVGGPFLNAVAELVVRLTPAELLEALLRLEEEAGRVRRGRRPGPRPLDLDLLLFGSRCVEAPGLCLPHPRLHERAFVLRPLLDLDPDLVHPRLGEPLRTLLEQAVDREGLRPHRRPLPGFGEGGKPRDRRP